MREQPKKRPTSITVVAWFLIVIGVLSLISSTIAFMSQNPMVEEMMSKNPIPIPMQHLLSFAGLTVSIVSGIWILKGQNWARFLYFFWSVITITIGIFTAPNIMMMIPGLVIFAVLAFILFLSKASDYFDGVEDVSDSESA
jgi:NAD/NADP transhydrogenase beta subunit